MDEGTGRKWSSHASILAGVCLFALALSHVFGLATPLTNLVLGLGVVAAGTVVWAIQARQKCPRCGTPYGYRVRLLKANLCPKCGFDLRDG